MKLPKKYPCVMVEKRDALSYSKILRGSNDVHKYSNRFRHPVILDFNKYVSKVLKAERCK